MDVLVEGRQGIGPSGVASNEYVGRLMAGGGVGVPVEGRHDPRGGRVQTVRGMRRQTR